jgi:hypothetical protein
VVSSSKCVDWLLFCCLLCGVFHSAELKYTARLLRQLFPEAMKIMPILRQDACNISAWGCLERRDDRRNACGIPWYWVHLVHAQNLRGKKYWDKVWRTRPVGLPWTIDNFNRWSMLKPSRWKWDHQFGSRIELMELTHVTSTSILLKTLSWRWNWWPPCPWCVNGTEQGVREWGWGCAYGRERRYLAGL